MKFIELFAEGSNDIGIIVQGGNYNTALRVHGWVVPDMDQAIAAMVGSPFGSAGECCMVPPPAPAACL